MYAVIKAGGHQYKVSQGDRITIDYHSGSEGDKLVFDHVCMLSADEVVLGNPTVQGASVEAVIKRQMREPKVIVFKYKRRKNHKKTRGHRQPVTVVEISAINK
ncbi:MAG: 50S ribosomal protein L21 [Oligoflexales bacterium]|nr:50S ribosomal protein L21 [Oligoflexales bacterium]